MEEASRTKRLGQEGISATLTPDFVHAVREMDELEGLAQPLPEPEEDEEQEQDAEDEPTAKRQRMIEPQPIQVPQSNTSGLLSSNALESLKYVTSLKQQQQQKSATQAKPQSGLGGLADYGSDSE